MNVKSKQIRLFITPYCPWCHKAERWLREHGIGYQAIDVISDETAYAEMIAFSGYIKSHEGTFPTGALMTGTFTVKIAGTITKAAAA